MAYAKVIVNPAAGAGKTARIWPDILAALHSANLDFDYEMTVTRGQATEIARTAASQGYAIIVAVGGDGTANEVANGLFQSGCLNRVALGIVPTGTGSDYIRTIGVPSDYREACQRLVSAKRLTVDLGIIEFMNGGNPVSRIFLNCAGAGLDAEITRATKRQLKYLSPRLSYFGGLLFALLSYRNRRLWLKIDETREERRVCMALMGIGKYGGGGMLVAPDADPGDGLFDVIVVGDVAKPDLLWTMRRVYRGTYLTHKKVMAKRAREVEILPIQPIAVQADGELLGEAPARFKLLPSALQVVV